jgi:hypothetical protein
LEAFEKGARASAVCEESATAAASHAAVIDPHPIDRGRAAAAVLTPSKVAEKQPRWQ